MKIFDRDLAVCLLWFSSRHSKGKKYLCMAFHVSFIFTPTLHLSATPPPTPAPQTHCGPWVQTFAQHGPVKKRYWHFDSIKFIHLTWLRQIKTQSPGGVFILPACSQHFFGFRPHYDITEFLQPQMTLCLFGVGFSVPLGTVFMVPGGQRNLSIWFNCCSLLQSSDRSHHSRCAPAQIFSYPAFYLNSIHIPGRIQLL